MNDQFDELTKGLAQSVTRRLALKKFALGIAGVMLASLGLAAKSQEPTKGCDHCNPATNFGCTTLQCYNTCYAKCFRNGMQVSAIQKKASG